MTTRASDLLSDLADRLSAHATESGMVAAEAVRAIEPEILKEHKDGSVDELVKTSIAFLEILFTSLRPDSRVPWNEYYALAREASRRYAEKGVPLESLMEGLNVFRRSVLARVTDEVGTDPYADEVLLLAQSRVGDVIEHLNSSFIRGYLDFTEARHRARQSELHGLYHIASALGRSLDLTEIAEVGLRETLKVLGLQAGVRGCLESGRPRGTFWPGLGMGAHRDPGFSKSLAARGWVGMALPARYGGRDRTAVDRFVVVEELQIRPMLDLTLFRRPAFTVASIVAFTLSVSLFAMFRYLTLYIQAALG